MTQHSMIKTVQAFSTSDGKLFSTAESARDWQRTLNIKALLREDGVGSGGDWDGDMFAQWLTDNWTKLLSL